MENLSIWFILGNIVSFIGCVLFGISTVCKKRDIMLKLQVLNSIPSAISSFMLWGITGGIINIIAFIRNFLAYKNKLTKSLTIILVVILAVISLYFNNLGIIGILPVIGCVEWTCALFLTKDIIKTKFALFFNILFGTFYNAVILNIPGLLLNLTLICTTSWSIFSLIKERRKKTKLNLEKLKIKEDLTPIN